MFCGRWDVFATYIYVYIYKSMGMSHRFEPDEDVRGSSLNRRGQPTAMRLGAIGPNPSYKTKRKLDVNNAQRHILWGAPSPIPVGLRPPA